MTLHLAPPVNSELSEVEVNFNTFGGVYCKLQDLVEVATPNDITEVLSESIADDDAGTLDAV